MPGNRGPTISVKVRREIRRRALERPWGPRGALATELQEVIKRWGEPVPGQETLEKMISDMRNSGEDQDKLWSLVSLPSYPITPEAIPYVLKVWARAIEKDNPITIREALWVGRLYSISEANTLARLEETHKTVEVQTQQGQEKPKHVLTSLLDEADDIDTLWDFAQVFAVNERVLNREESYPDTREALLSFWQNDAEAYGVLPEGPPFAGELSTRISRERAGMTSNQNKREAQHERPYSQEG